MCETHESERLVPQGRPELHSLSVPALKGLGRALELLRRRKGWSAAEAARHIPLDPSNLGKYERDAKSITVTTLERILDGYEATLADLAEILKEVQGGSPVRWIVPGEVSEEDLKRVVKKVLGRDWVPDEPEEEASQGQELPNGGEDGG
jgi:transcriptional regulator with XRE-family HTH domain